MQKLPFLAIAKAPLIFSAKNITAIDLCVLEHLLTTILLSYPCFQQPDPGWNKG